MALRAGGVENAATFAASQAMRAAWLGLFAQARTLAEAGLKYEGNQVSVATAALALALAGNGAGAVTISEGLATRNPKNTLVNQLWLPEMKAAVALGSGDPRAASICWSRRDASSPRMNSSRSLCGPRPS